MEKFQNTFSWSKSRDEMFRECLRKYYYQYYASWGGWYSDADQETRRIYVLKQLKTRQMWSGTAVHECIARALKNIRRGIEPMNEAQAIAATVASMREGYINSREGKYWDNTKSCALFEHEYKLDIPDEVWKQEADHVSTCLQTFYRSEIFQKVKDLSASRWLDLEDFSFFLLDGVKIFAVLDFSFKSGDDIVIYDWKTGKTDTEKNEIQLACYIFYAIGKWNVKPHQVQAIEFNLAKGRETNHKLNSTELVSIQEYIRGSFRDMQLLLEDVKENKANEENFPPVEDDKPCRYCNFKKACPKWS